MAYTISNTDGTTLLILADGQIDKSTTSLTLIGKNYPAYGEELNNNFITLLANGANNSGSPPRSPLLGQLWYDTSDKRIKVYDNGFKTVGGVEVSPNQPDNLQTGDLWFDTITKQLKVSFSGVIYTVGPTIPTNIGFSGLSLPETIITDQDDVPKNLLLLRSYGNTLAVFYNDDTGNKQPFQMDNTDKNTYIPNASTSTVVSGITVIGDLNVLGKLSNDYLSLHVNLDVIAPAAKDALTVFLSPDLGEPQNGKISKILNEVYPPNPTSLSSTSTVMNGVLLGTQARVLCQFSEILGVSRTGYQVRVFRTVGNNTTATWQAYKFRTDTVSSSIVEVNYISTSTF